MKSIADNTELVWWENEFGKRRTWKLDAQIDMNKLQYEPKKKAEYGWETYWPANKLGTMGFKVAAIKLKNDGGGFNINDGRLNFIGAKYKEEQPIKTYNFARFTAGVVEDSDESKHKEKFDPKHINFIDDRNEIDPIQTDTTDSGFQFDNENAVVVNLKKGKK